jgi:O-antigen/teichoic acid export membrane protein
MINKLFLSYFSQLAPILISFIALPLIYARVPIEDIGRYESTLFLGALLLVFSRLSLPSVYFRHKLKEETSSLFIIRILEILCCLLFFLMAVIFLTTEITHLLIENCYFISLIVLILIEALKKDIQSDENYLLAIKIFVSCAIFVQCIKVMFVLYGYASYSGLLVGDILLNFVYLIVYVVYRKRLINIPRIRDIATSLGFLNFDKKYWLTLYLHHVISFVNQHLVKIIVIMYLSSSDMALLALSIKILLPISLSMDAFFYWLSPLVFKGKVKTTVYHILIVFGLGALFLVFAELFYDVIFLMIFPEIFIESKSIFMILLFAQILNIVYRISAVQILASSNVSVLLIITTINFIFSACIIYIVDFELSLEIVASITIIQSLVQVCSIYAYTRYNSQPA